MSKKICSVDGCKDQHKSLGFCNKHYRRFKKFGDPLHTKTKMDHDEWCGIEGCNRPYLASGYCSKHYRRFYVHGNPTTTCSGSYPERHGMTNAPEYSVWCGMKERCNNPKNKSYSSYGGRGIIICDRWNSSFINFYKDMGSRPTATHQIDRTDSNGNYEPDNCEWVTPLENARNKDFVKLNINKAREIRELYKPGNMSYREVGIIYGVGWSVIEKVVNNHTWKE